MTSTSSQNKDNTHSSEDYRPGSRPPFLYKSGPDWTSGPLKVHPAIVPQPLKNTWDSVCEQVIERLDSSNIRWRSITPLAYGHAGEARPFCPFLITVGVDPNSVQYEDAVRAADAVKEVLAEAGCPEVEVGFEECVYWGSMAASQSLDDNRNHSDGVQEQE